MTEGNNEDTDDNESNFEVESNDEEAKKSKEEM